MLRLGRRMLDNRARAQRDLPRPHKLGWRDPRVPHLPRRRRRGGRDRLVQQADAAGKFGFGWIAQQLPTWTKHDGQLPSVDMETIDQRLGVRIGLRVQSLVRVTIAAEKTFEAEDIPILRTSNDYWSAGAGFKEADATKNQRAHNTLAELCLRNQ